MLSTRLAQLQTDDYRFTHHNFDVASSNRSKEPSVDEDNGGDMDSNIKVLSNGGRDKTALGRASMSLPVLPASPVVEGSVPIALGSPTVNPRIEEYLSFTSKDLPTKAPSACFPSTFVDTALSVSKMATDNESLISRNSFKSDSGVTEQSNWAEELEDCVDRACMRLEQLARDEFITDPSVSVEEYYIARLKRLLGSGKREIPVSIQKMAKPL
ncbi:hypothetical protein BKA66DRAFT_459596 [Pyrenochaeta sp. MPI-SDFR-AT-0127]|nr:hypothetical protein BKA66DRAFT_459596 [Pyrenochaeta sp. MPI-SDFR-AT-0127]